MKSILKSLIGISIAFTSIAGFGQPQAPFKRGVNLTTWFQNTDTRQIQFSKFTKKDFENIKSLGCDVIRLPIYLNEMTDGSPNYTIDPLLFEFLDQAVDWAEQLNLNIILDNHSFEPNDDTSPAVGTVLTKVWAQMADHFQPRSSLVFYEVLNEPHGISASAWGAIQQTVIDAIRTKDSKHTIIVGGVNYNNYNDLATLPVYADQNLIYTFHFYDPFIFTHQGATWTDPSMAPVSGVPFPYDAAKMPPVPTSLKGTWIESLMNDYKNQGSVARIEQLLDVAVNFATQRNVKVYCGEFGVFIPNTDNSQRIAWYSALRNYLEKKKIAWTMWDYTGSFGIFNKNSQEFFDYDVNIPLVQTLGLIAPEQKLPKEEFQKTELVIYDDYLSQGIIETSYAAKGTLDLYSSDDVKFDKYAIQWQNVEQYASIILDFKPNVNLALLPENNYQLDFWIKGNTHGMNFDIRFVDTKKDATDHPWRFGLTIDESVANWDSEWHHVTIPLKNLQDKGSFDDVWLPPPGKFSWAEVDKIEFSPEQGFVSGTVFLLDQIKLSGEPIVTTDVEENIDKNFSVYPNPASETVFVTYSSPVDRTVLIELCNTLGQIMATNKVSQGIGGLVKTSFDVSNLTNGIYLVRVTTSKKSFSKKVIVK
ncbi:MAG: cellulase family glycosylhydrolase [Chryseolinea sp.]